MKQWQCWEWRGKRKTQGPYAYHSFSCHWQRSFGSYISYIGCWVLINSYCLKVTAIKTAHVHLHRKWLAQLMIFFSFSECFAKWIRNSWLRKGHITVPSYLKCITEKSTSFQSEPSLELNISIWPKDKEDNKFLTFPACFLIPSIFSSLNSNCSNLSSLRNLQEQVKKAFCYQDCSDLSLFE